MTNRTVAVRLFVLRLLALLIALALGILLLATTLRSEGSPKESITTATSLGQEPLLIDPPRADRPAPR